MHELSITENLVQILQDQAHEQGFSKVLKLRLEVGLLSTLEPDSLSFCFDVVAKDTVVEGAEVIIERPPGQARCRSCGESFAVAGYGATCPGCANPRLEILSGTEMRILDIEVE